MENTGGITCVSYAVFSSAYKVFCCTNDSFKANVGVLVDTDTMMFIFQ